MTKFVYFEIFWQIEPPIVSPPPSIVTPLFGRAKSFGLNCWRCRVFIFLRKWFIRPYRTVFVKVDWCYNLAHSKNGLLVNVRRSLFSSCVLTGHVSVKRLCAKSALHQFLNTQLNLKNWFYLKYLRSENYIIMRPENKRFL